MTVRRVARDAAVDLGSAAVRVHTRVGSVVEEASLVARASDGRAVAFGTNALDFVGRHPAQISMVRPVVDGVIGDVAACDELVRFALRRALGRRARRPRLIVTVPAAATGLERRAARHAVEAAGGRVPAVVLESPLAAAIGAGLAVEEAFGSMVVDVGRGITEAAVVCLGTLVATSSSYAAGAALDAAVARHLRDGHRLAVGERSAEAVKIRAGHAARDGDEIIAVRGVDTATGLPATIEVAVGDLSEAMSDVLDAIATTVRNALDAAPPTLAADVMDQGILLVGGTARLPGLAERIANATGIAVDVVSNPERAVIAGAGECLAVAPLVG